MFGLSRNMPAKSGNWVEFKFSNLKAIKVPKGWDKLFVCIHSVESGKTITKSSKALVRNGSCEWSDTLMESIWMIVSEDPKEMSDRLFKFVVAMGSTRSGILGETTINMTSYMNSSALVSVSLPLKKNNYGTVLQVTIHRMDKRMKVRNGESKESNFHVEDLKVDSHATDVGSEVSDGISPQSFTSSSSKDRSSASHHGEPESRQTSFSGSGSHQGYDSADIFLTREDLSPISTGISGNGHNLRQESSSSHGNHPADNACRMREDATEELRAEAKMWERNARKLMLDLDMLRKEFSDQSKSQADLEMELSAMRAECNELRKEVEQLKLISSLEDGTTQLQEELEKEIKFQREASADLAMQLKRSQESNVKLVALLQELELEKSVVQSKADDMDNCLQEKMEENAELTIKVLMLGAKLSESIEEHDSAELEPCNGGDVDLITEMEALKEKVQELERDCTELTDENLELLFKLKEINNKSTGLCTCCTDDNFDVSIQQLKSSKMDLESKVAELGIELDNRRSEIAKLEANLMSKEEGITELEAKVAELEKENTHLEENMKAVARESDITSKCFNDLQNDLIVVSGKRELLELEEENVQLSDCVSTLEAQLRHLTDKSESGRLELEHFKSLAENLQNETTTLRSGMEIQKVELKEKLQDMQRRCSAVEEECEYLRRSNLELQATAEKLIEECTSLQRLNGELNENCVKLEAKLRESSQSFSECSEKVTTLEENLSLALEDIAAKERSLTSELGTLLEENKKQEEKFIAEQVLFSEIEAYLQEVESKLKHAENERNVGLRAELSATKLDKEELEGSLHRVLGEREELKAENISLVEKISTLQSAVFELEDCKRGRVALESKLLEMECDYNRINRTNCQFQRKIQQLEKDKDECLTKSHTLEDELKAMKEERHNQRESGSVKAKTNAKVSPAREDTKFLKSEMAKSPNRHRDSRKKLSLRNDQAHEPVRNRLKPSNIQHHKEVSNGSCVHDQHPQPVDLDSFSKIQWLENELAKAVEANKPYKAQLNRLRSEGQIPHYGGEVVAKERFERTKSLLETELKDIRERYLHMSLRYAEVESQREELVMKLKAAKNDKRWFS